MRADKAMVYIIIAVVLVTWGLLYPNRGSEKIFGALLVILTTTLATGLGSLLVILRPETRTEEFVAVFIYDSKEKRPLLTESYPIRKRVGLVGSGIWADAMDSQGTETKSSPAVAGQPMDHLQDFLMRCMVEQISMRLHNAWLVEARAWSVPGADQSSWGPAKEAQKLPKTELLKDELLSQMRSKGNAFAFKRTETNGMFEKMTLPPGTKVSYLSPANGRELLLTNPFVRLSIATVFSSMGVLQHDFYGVFTPEEADKNRYYQASFRVRISANFSSWRAGWEMMTYHKRWVESVITLLRETFDWAPVAQEIKEQWTTRQLEKLGSS